MERTSISSILSGASPLPQNLAGSKEDDTLAKTPGLLESPQNASVTSSLKGMEAGSLVAPTSQYNIPGRKLTLRFKNVAYTSKGQPVRCFGSRAPTKASVPSMTTQSAHSRAHVLGFNAGNQPLSETKSHLAPSRWATRRIYRMETTVERRKASLGSVSSNCIKTGV